eukprot:1195733-Prorocentrum_minimum.AAC.10
MYSAAMYSAAMYSAAMYSVAMHSAAMYSAAMYSAAMYSAAICWCSGCLQLGNKPFAFRVTSRVMFIRVTLLAVMCGLPGVPRGGRSRALFAGGRLGLGPPTTPLDAGPGCPRTRSGPTPPPRLQTDPRSENGPKKKGTSRTGVVYRAQAPSYAGGAGRTGLRASLRGGLQAYTR